MMKKGEKMSIDGNVRNNKKNNLLVCINNYHIWLHHKMRRSGFKS